VDAAREHALVAVQLEIGPDVLASADAYRAHIDRCAARALAGAQAASARLLVFPENAGHLALYALAPPVARKTKTLAAALAAAAVRRPLDVLRGIATTRLLDTRHAVLGALAPDGERFWKSVFGPLARRHDAYVVAGSYLRLHPDGELTNTSLLFGPDGRLLAMTDKVNLVAGVEDGAKSGLGLARGDSAIPIVETPIGRIATLVGYDAFREAQTAAERFVALGPLLAERGSVGVVANPAANPWPWRERWKYAASNDTRTRGEHWDREGLRGSLAAWPFARRGVTAHLVGRVLDLRFEGTRRSSSRRAGRSGCWHARTSPIGAVTSPSALRDTQRICRKAVLVG
jgi:predicted amidohydrolase